MGNKVRFGLKSVNVAFRDVDSSGGEPTWGTPIPIPGAVGFKPAAEGDDVKFFADNSAYFTATANNGYTADLEVALIPDSVLIAMMNWATDANGAVVEDADALPAPFALMFEVEGDARNRRTVFYECYASRPEREEKTKGQSLEPGSETLKITITPITIDGVSTVKSTLELSDTNATQYDAFFTDVYVPEAVA